MSMDENKTIVRRFFEELWNAKQLDRIDELVARDYIDGNPLPGQAPGLEAAKQKWAMYFAGIPDLSAKLEDLVAEGDKVVVRFTAEGTHEGTLLGVPPTGKRLRISGISIYRLAEGKVVEHWEEGDRLGLLQQLGVIPAPAAHGDCVVVRLGSGVTFSVPVTADYQGFRQRVGLKVYPGNVDRTAAERDGLQWLNVEVAGES
jgi:steroid delta-isomerase-like uncharacterized protein